MAVPVVSSLLCRRHCDLREQQAVSTSANSTNGEGRTRSSILNNAVLASNALLKLLILLVLGSSTPALMLSRTSPFARSRP